MTIRLIYEEDERLLPWAAARIGIPRFQQDARTIGQETDGQLSAVIVYDNFSRCDCSIHVASDGTRHWLNRALLLAAFGYPFTQLKLRRVTALVAAGNKDSLRLVKHLGFRVEGYSPHALPDDDITILGMLRDDCRYIPKEQGA